MSLTTTVQNYLHGLFGVHEDSSETVLTELKKYATGHISATIVANANAATATPLTYVMRAPASMRITSAYWIGDTAVTAVNTNYKTFRVLKGNGTAAAATVVASYAMGPDTTQSNVAANTPFVLTLSATEANLNLTAGQTLAVDIAVAGTGVAVGIGAIHIEWRYT